MTFHAPVPLVLTADMVGMIVYTSPDELPDPDTLAEHPQWMSDPDWDLSVVVVPFASRDKEGRVTTIKYVGIWADGSSSRFRKRDSGYVDRLLSVIGDDVFYATHADAVLARVAADRRYAAGLQVVCDSAERQIATLSKGQP